MSQENHTLKLLGMEGVIVGEIEESEESLVIHLEMEHKEQHCPRCGQATTQVHDYRTLPLSDLSLRGKRSILLYRKRRYRCPCCQKRFAEHCGFVGRYQRFTYRVTEEIFRQLRSRKSLCDIARDTDTSVSGVLRCMKLFPQGKPEKLPRVLSFDEFRGNVDGERFQCILTAPEEKRVLDILPGRTVTELQSYLKPFANRHEVEYVVMDMNRGFRDVARAFFPNAKIVIDRFHVMRYCTWAMDNVRRRVQERLQPDTRKYFKRSRKLLLAHTDLLTDVDKLAVTRMLDFSEELWRAYALKEAFYSLMASPSRTAAAVRLGAWLAAFDRLHIREFRAYAKMLRNWKEYILNAFDVPYSNGFTEGCNNATKTLKRIAFGYRNFLNFRARILLAVAAHHNI